MQSRYVRQILCSNFQVSKGIKVKEYALVQNDKLAKSSISQSQGADAELTAK